MSFNKLIYDNCSYQERDGRSREPLSYVMYDGKYQHNAPCRIPFGILAGNTVSQSSKNLVDLESNLLGIDRRASNCGCQRYQPMGQVQMVNLPECQMVDYKRAYIQPPPVPSPQRCPPYPSHNGVGFGFGFDWRKWF